MSDLSPLTSQSYIDTTKCRKLTCKAEFELEMEQQLNELNEEIKKRQKMMKQQSMRLELPAK
jgi:hypothetical protein